MKQHVSISNNYLSDTILASRYGVHRSTVWRWVSDRNFPKPIQLSPACTRWKLSDVEAWEASQEGA